MAGKPKKKKKEQGRVKAEPKVPQILPLHEQFHLKDDKVDQSYFDKGNPEWFKLFVTGKYDIYKTHYEKIEGLREKFKRSNHYG